MSPLAIGSHAICGGYEEYGHFGPIECGARSGSQRR